MTAAEFNTELTKAVNSLPDAGTSNRFYNAILLYLGNSHEVITCEKVYIENKYMWMLNYEQINELYKKHVK